jgi:chorismate mutase
MSVTFPIRLKNKPEEQIQKPFLVAGPCSAESEDQLQEVFASIKHLAPDVNLFRAGIWKPRTRPNSFEGLGEAALPWAVSAAKAQGIPLTVEVAKAQHVEAALKAGVDVLWIGARTTVNPFQVQDIADALKGTAIPVLVKNPINPDLGLWIGAIERLNAAGINEVAAIHRGFSVYEKSKYRNLPSWEIPIELRRRLPGLPILVDPSHIAGSREFLQEVAQRGMDLGFDGLMLETHPDPDNALSDSAQQITPEVLARLLDDLVYRRTATQDFDTLEELVDKRARIDRIDSYLLELLAERMGIAEEIGLEKKERNIAIYQPARWKKVMQRALEIGRKSDLSEEFILAVFQQIRNESIRHQTRESNPED